MASDVITIYLDDKRQALATWWQKLQHAIGGAPLLVAGMHALRDPVLGHRVLAVAEIIVAVVLLVTLVRELRAEVRTRRNSNEAAHAHHGHGPDWFDVAAGVLLILEAWHLSQRGGKAFYLRPYFLLGMVTLLLGVFHGPYSDLILRRRYLRLDDSGVHGRLSRFRRISAPWQDVRGIRVDAREAVIETTSRSFTISLKRYQNAGAIREALAGWRERRLVAIGEEAGLP
jgi:hypothetical protein